MSYDDNYATCERTLAELRIYGDDLDPDHITATLEIAPSATQRKGELSPPNELGRCRRAALGGWFLSSEDHVESRDLRRHLDWVLTMLQPTADGLRRLQQISGIRMHIYCVWWSKHGQGGPTLSAGEMKTMGELNLECQLDISFFGDDDEGSPRTPRT